MPFDSSGTFNRLRSWVADAAAGIKIRADYHDDEDNNFAAALSQCIVKDGRTQPTANLPMNAKRLINLGEPVAATDAATKQYIDNAILAAQTAMALPPGVMMPYTKVGSLPVGWLYCNGALINRVAYATLFGVLGTTFGAGDGATTFALPDMRGRFPRGWNDDLTPALDPGRVFGSQQADELEAHAHTATSGGESVDHQHYNNFYTDTRGAHTHDISVRATAGGTGGVAIGNLSSTLYTGAADNYAQSDGDHLHLVAGYTGYRSAGHTHAITVNTAGGAETRPQNLALVWIIKS